MTNKEIMAALGNMRKLMYSVPFQGDQVMIISECIKIIDISMQNLNKSPGDQVPADG